jgi:hypothetical protein
MSQVFCCSYCKAVLPSPLHACMCKLGLGGGPRVEGKAAPQSPLSTQIGGGHYKDMAIQPMEYSMANGFNACQHTAIKYISRYQAKGGLEDLKKAIHVLEMLIEFETKSSKA